MIISDEFISFFFEELEEPKIPIQFVHTVELLEDGSTLLVKAGTDSKEIGELQVKVVSDPYLIRNALRFIVKVNKQ